MLSGLEGRTEGSVSFSLPTLSVCMSSRELMRAHLHLLFYLCVSHSPSSPSLSPQQKGARFWFWWVSKPFPKKTLKHLPLSAFIALPVCHKLSLRFCMKFHTKQNSIVNARLIAYWSKTTMVSLFVTVQSWYVEKLKLVYYQFNLADMLIVHQLSFCGKMSREKSLKLSFQLKSED